MVPLLCTCLLEVRPTLRPSDFWRPFSARHSWGRNNSGNLAKLTAMRRAVTMASIADAQEKKIIVFAAASMKNALDDVNPAFTKQSGSNVVVSYDASSALMKQIENGAPADVFVSADLKWMDYGSERKLIKDDTRVNLLGSELVLIAAKDPPIGSVTIEPGFDLASLRVTAASRRET